MCLSFISELNVGLPEYLQGTNRFQNINKLLTYNSSWRKESQDALKSILKLMHDNQASDIDIGGPGSYGPIWFRIYGEKTLSEKINHYSHDEVTAILLSILSDEQKLMLFRDKSVDFSLELLINGDKYSHRYRGNIYFESNHLVANFRRINTNLFKINELNIPKPIVHRLDLQYEKSGLVLVTGTAGSGKSSTLDSIIDLNNQANKSQIIIIGNPIEYVHKSKHSLIRHREIGTDVLSFKDGTKQALRQDPDIIVVGEMRDPDTIATVLEVSDSGHKVFSTLHTISAVDSIHRIIGEFPTEEQERVRLRLADILSVIISQKLIPNKQGKLTLVKEILSVNDSIRAAIRNKNINEIYQMINEGRKEGMITLEQDLANLYQNGIISNTVALNYSNNKKRMEQLLIY